MAREKRFRILIAEKFYSANETEFNRWKLDLARSIAMANDPGNYFKLTGKPYGYKVIPIVPSTITTQTNINELPSHKYSA